MPTASEFDRTSGELEDIAVWVGGPLTAIGCAHQDVAIGGWVADLIERTIDDATRQVRTVATSCRDAATLARQRADACRAYTAAMVAHRSEVERLETLVVVDPSAHGTISWPSRPAPPGPWADEG